MKRRVVKISLAIIVIATILLSLLVLLTLDSGSRMTFGFLDGRALTARIERNPGRSAFRTTRDVYSFKADFNDVCAKVDAELTALGFTRLMDMPDSDMREYRLNNSSNKLILVRVLNRNILSVYSTPKSSKYSNPDRHEYRWRSGWVSVEIAQTRLRAWPPQYLLIRLQPPAFSAGACCATVRILALSPCGQ